MTSNLAGDDPIQPHAREGVDPASRTDRAQPLARGAQVGAQLYAQRWVDAQRWRANRLPAWTGSGTNRG